MSFVLSGTTITQSGTDTSLSGLNAISGVTTETSKLIRYTLADRVLVITGTLTIPITEMLRFTGSAGNSILINNGGTLNFGSVVSVARSSGAVSVYSQYTSLEMLKNTGTPYATGNMGLRVLSGGTLRINGGNWVTNQAIQFNSGATIVINSADIYFLSEAGYQNIYMDAPAMTVNGLRLINTATMQGLAGLRANYTQLKGYEPINFDNSGTIDSLDFGTINLTDFVGGKSVSDIKFRTSSNNNLYNVFGSNIGNNLLVIGNGGGQSQGHLKHFIRFNPRILNTNETPILGAKILITDTNNGSRSATFENANKSYLGETLISGRAGNKDILTGLFHNNGNNSVIAFTLDNRLPVVGAVLSYNHLQSAISVSDSTISDQNGDLKLLNDTNVTLSEANAITKLASSFIVDMPTNKITITANSTLDDLYDVMKVFKTRNIQSQLEYPTINTQPITANGNTLVTTMSIIGLEFLTIGTKFKNIQANCTANASFTNINVIGSVTQNAPTNLTNVNITGVLNYNVASNNNVTLTNSNATTVNNNGIGVVSVKKVNSNFANGTNITSYVPTFLNLSLNGGRILILDNLGVEKLNQTTDGLIELDSAAVGNWTYRIAKFGNKLIENTFTIDGTTKQITASFIPDTFVNDTLVNVQGYTSLDGTQQIYDYQSYNLTTINGIRIGNKLSKGFGTLSVDGAFTTDSSQVALFSFSSGIITTKTVNLLENATLIVTGNFTQNTTVLSNEIKVRALNLDSEILFTTDNVVFYPTLNDRNAGSNIGETATGGIYRYKYGNTYSGVIMTTPLHVRYNIGTTTSLDILLLTQYNYKLEITTTQLIAQINDNLKKVNNNVINASLLIPANETF